MEASLRRGLKSLVGLKRLKAMAARDIAACKHTREVFPHTMLTGPGGLGKTSFAEAIAYDLGYHFEMVEGAMFKCRRSIIGKLVACSLLADARGKRLLFFIDEVHRLAKEPQEAIYYPLLKFYIPETKTRLSPFSVFAATTHPQDLLRPFKRRFENDWAFSRYDLDEIEVMVAGQLESFGLDANSVVVHKVAKRSLGIPSLAYNLAKKIRNAVLSKGRRVVSDVDCENTFHLEGLDELGLTLDQVEYLKVLCDAAGVPKGVGGLAGALDRDVEVVGDSIEPVLLSLKFIDRTPRGRVLTELGHLHLARTGQL